MYTTSNITGRSRGGSRAAHLPSFQVKKEQRRKEEKLAGQAETQPSLPSPLSLRSGSATEHVCINYINYR